MKKLIFALFAVLVICMSGCSKYDDSDLWNSVNDLDKRVKTLEELCKQMNTNITSIQTIINASKDGDYITSITPLTEGGKEIGYTITFSKSPSITIYHGKDGQNGANGSDGKDGITPNISVKKDTDGFYYWTLNGEWILDDSGKKILAQGINGNDGQSGRDGITPQLKIEDGGWYISYDNGQTWTFLGKATAEGENGDSMFKSIDTSNPDYVIFTLADGSEIKLARHDELSISFDSEDLIAMQPNSTRSIKYTIAGATGNLKVEVLSSGNIRAKISDNTSATGTVTVTTGATIDEYDKVIMLATDGKTTVMSSLYFEEGYLRVTNGTSYQLDAQCATLSINIETNTEYTLSIPEDAKSWISIASSRAVRQETITLNIAANEDAARTATLALLSSGGQSLCDIQIFQSGEKDGTMPSDMSVAFPDNWFLKYILENFDSNGDGVISQQEADNANTIDFSDYYNLRKNIRSLEGIQYFQNLTRLCCEGMSLTTLDVSKNTALTQLDCIENNLDALDVSKNTALTELSCSKNRLTTLDVTNNTSLSYLNCSSNQLTTLDVSNNTALTKLYCNNNQLATLDVSKNTALTMLRCYSNQLTTLDVSNNTALSYLDCISNQLTSLDVSNNTALTKLYCNNNQLATLDVSKNTNLEWLDCSRNHLTSLDISKTSLYAYGNIGGYYPLDCAPMPSLKTLYLKTGWTINGITNRSINYIPDQTEIVFID